MLVPPQTAFPNPVNLGMTFDTALAEAVGTAIGDEARAIFNARISGSGLCLSPVLNQARDPRWGRSYESYGEDPFAISSLGAAYIRGMQYGPGTILRGEYTHRVKFSFPT